MKYAIKNIKKVVTAYPLGAGHPMEQVMITVGAIKHLPNGDYELFSQEAVNGSGQIAHPGDYFKVDVKDGKSFPYPNEKEFFEANHTPIGGDMYEQANKPLMIWQADDEMIPEVQWLVDTGRLTLKHEDPDNFFNAFLWGADLSAAKEATLIFYSVDRNANGAITNVDFNFVAKPEFEANYTVL